MGGVCVAEQLVELKLCPLGVPFQCCTTVYRETTTNNEQTEINSYQCSQLYTWINFGVFCLERKKYLSLEISCHKFVSMFKDIQCTVV